MNDNETQDDMRQGGATLHNASLVSNCEPSVA